MQNNINYFNMTQPGSGDCPIEMQECPNISEKKNRICVKVPSGSSLEAECPITGIQLKMKNDGEDEGFSYKDFNKLKIGITKSKNSLPLTSF